MPTKTRDYNGVYSGEHLNHVAFPLGGMGAGTICLEGTGALSHVSLRHRPDVFNEPCVFSALCIKGGKSVARVLEGPVPKWKAFGRPGMANGAGGTTWGLPRLRSATFEARFPFGVVRLADDKVPLRVTITGWSPFIPRDADNSSLPVAALEYVFRSAAKERLQAVYSFNARNFMALGRDGHAVRRTESGFILRQDGSENQPWEEGSFCALVLDADAKVNCTWFRGGWFDPLTIAWKDIEEGACYDRPPAAEGQPSPGGTIFAPFELAPGEEKTVTLLLSWYVPKTDLRLGRGRDDADECECSGGSCAAAAGPVLETYRPWYAERFADIEEVARYWRDNYAELRTRTLAFSDCFYDTTLPAEVVEAVAANLAILKSPTVLRQADGRLWCFEGCCDGVGCCHGSCTHVWNYAQAVPHLFPELERSLRQTEFNECQDDNGHQTFRAPLPIRPAAHDTHAAADGQLGGIMKMYREWRISGDSAWLRGMWPKVTASLDYCIRTWDPDHTGVLVEPHHNTYDIEFWGPDGMCSTFYLGALKAAIAMGAFLGQDVALYAELLEKGVEYVEENLFNGEYFFQEVRWRGLRAGDPAQFQTLAGGQYSPEALELLQQEGPKYQYGTGCLADGVLGAWMAAVCGVEEFIDRQKLGSHLNALYEYNFREDLSAHANTQRPTFGFGDDGGLVVCTWPRGGKPSLPFPYSDEVWTGTEYHVASHLIMMGRVEQGLDIVRAVRDRYDGVVRNPFDEYECGHWYARAMSSYALIRALSGVRYDAVDRALYIAPAVEGDFRSFLSTATGYGTVGVREGKPFLEVSEGVIETDRIDYTPAGAR